MVRFSVNPVVTLAQSVHASLAYRHWNNLWSHDENLRRYGSMASPEGLGGNWIVELAGRVAEADLHEPLGRIKSLLDHRCLFTDVAEFRDSPSTLENVTLFLGRQFLVGDFEFLSVHESDSLSCTLRAGVLTLRFRLLNLTLDIEGVPDESGLMTSREQVTQSVIETHAQFANASDLLGDQWAQSVLENLKQSVRGLALVRIDLGGGQYIVVG